MIEQGFNYADSTIKEMTDFIVIRVDNKGFKEAKKKSSTVAKLLKDRKSTKKGK